MNSSEAASASRCTFVFGRMYKGPRVSGTAGELPVTWCGAWRSSLAERNNLPSVRAVSPGREAAALEVFMKERRGRDRRLASRRLARAPKRQGNAFSVRRNRCERKGESVRVNLGALPQSLTWTRRSSTACDLPMNAAPTACASIIAPSIISLPCYAQVRAHDPSPSEYPTRSRRAQWLV
jgi:hypothetical protein